SGYQGECLHRAGPAPRHIQTHTPCIAIFSRSITSLKIIGKGTLEDTFRASSRRAPGRSSYSMLARRSAAAWVGGAATAAAVTIFRDFARVKWSRMSAIMGSFWPDLAYPNARGVSFFA